MKDHFPVLLTAILSLSMAAMPGRTIAQNPGSLDLSFDPGTGADVQISTTAIQSDGRIVIGGYFTSYNGTPRNHIARLNADGSLDATFDPGAGTDDFVHTIAIQSDGRIVIGGYFTSYNGTPRNYIARLNADGSLDATFDPGAGASGIVYTTAIQSDGRIVIGGGFTFYNGMPRDRVARLNADGSLDATFDPGAGVGGGNGACVFTTIIQSDERIVIGGDFTSYNGTPKMYIARLNADGSLDVTFGAGVGANGFVYTIAIQSDGRFVVGGGFTSYNGTSRNRLARLNADGSLDATLDPGMGTAGLYPHPYTTAIQSDGRIVIGGRFTSYNGTPRNCIARLNADGSLDATFDPGTGANNLVHTIAIQGDGRIVIGGGFISYNETPRNCIARLNCDGTVGMEEIAPYEFSIFPNPASSSVTIVMPEQSGCTELVLRNALGQEVLRSSVTAGRNDIGLNGLAPGLYSVQVGTSAAQRLVVER